MIKLYNADTTEKIAGYIIGEWSDGNPSGENRIGRFVTSTNDNNKIKLASPDSYIAGVSEDYDGSTTMVKVNPIGISVVEDDGTLVEGDKCMPSVDGKAEKSSSNLGYRVLDRVDSTHVQVLVVPNNDMINRIKIDMDAKVNRDELNLAEIEESQIDMMFSGQIVADGDPDVGFISEITELEIDEIF